MDHLSRYADFARGPMLATYFYWLNVKVPPLDDVRVRRALSLAIDRESLVKYVTRAGQEPSADLGAGRRRRLCRPAQPDLRSRTRAALARRGRVRSSKPLPAITLRYNTLEGHKQIAEAVQQMWKQHLGVQVELENQEWKVFLKTLQATDFQIARMAWVGGYPTRTRSSSC